MKIGSHYAYREKRTPGSPFLKVKYLEKVEGKGKIKVRYEDGPHPGLEEYVRPQTIVSSWGQRKAVERDEERIQRLADHHVQSRADRALSWAITAVLCSTGEPSAWCEPDGVTMPEAEIGRIADRAGLNEEAVDLHALAFCDRDGNVHLPIEAAEAVARAFAAAEPETVLMSIEDDVEQLKTRGYAPGERFSHDYLREKSPGYALARQWAGHEQEVEQLQQEIGRLRRLVSMAEHDLRAAGKELEAAKLRRAVEGR